MSILLFLLLSIFLVLQVDLVQTWLGRAATAYLSSELDTEISIERVSFRLVKSVVLKGVLIKDLHGDTLVHTSEINVSISKFSTKDHNITVSSLLLSNGTFNLNRYKGEIHDNLHFLTSYFASTDTTAGVPWNIKIKNVELENMHFRRFDENDTAKVHGVNFSDLDLSSIYGEFNNFHVVNDTIFTDISKLKFKEKSGFSLNELSGNAKVSATEIKIDHLVITSPFTNLRTDLVLQFDSFAAFDEFTSQITWKSEFKKSTISFKDISYFTDELWGMNDSLKIEGNFKGKVNSFKGKGVTIQYGNNTSFKGNIVMNGLPKIEETYIELTADEIKSTKSDLESIPLPPFNTVNHLVIPENLEPLGVVKFKGRFTGFYNDFVAYGTISTALGSLSSDLNLKYDKARNTTKYSGHLSSNQFDAGVIAKLPDLGKVTLSLDVKGSGMRFDNVNAVLNGRIDAIEYKNYTYRKVDVNGNFAKKLFNGKLSVNEPNVIFDFLGTIDYRKALPEFNFTADIQRAQLDTLNLFKISGESVLQTTINTHFIGNKLDNIVGSIDIVNTNFRAGKKLYHINSISLNSETENGIRTVDVLSDNLDMNCRGIFEFATLGDAFKEIIPRYLPSVVLPRKSFKTNQNFTYNIRLKNLNVITENFLPSWDFAPNTVLTGHFNSTQYDFELVLKTPYVRYKNFTFEDMQIGADADRDRMFLSAKSHRILGADSTVLIELPDISALARNNKVSYSLHLADRDTFINRARVHGNFDFFSASKFTMKVDSSFLVIDNQQWKLDSANFLSIDTSMVLANRLFFNNGRESLFIDGKVSKDINDRLNVKLENFNINYINTIAKMDKNFLAGIMNGEIHISDVYHKPQIETNLTISSLAVYGDTIGNMSIYSSYNSDKELLSSTISAIKGTAKIIDVKGEYYMNKEQDNINYSIKLNNIYIHPIEKYVTGVLKDVYGKVSTDLLLTGTFARPLFNGTVNLNKVSLLIDYLQTHYSFTSQAKIVNNEIIIKDLTLTDDNNSEAILNGKVTHNYFRDFRFDVEMTANKFQVLKTTARDNSLYYGVANGTGYAHFYGPLNNMNMDISMSPAKGTVVNIPLNSSSDLSQSEYITFIDRGKDSTMRAHTGNRVDLSGVKLNMNLDMNRNALINIIFDEKIGDVISGSGTGSLRLDINTAGNFNMYGTYTIEKGDYLFTLQNLINKKFTIDNGSRITWAGDPYEANVDLSATYVVNTSSLYNLLADSTYKRRLPVECRLLLTNKLMNPTINYEIKVRGLDPAAESIVRTILNSEQEISKQMFGLLVFNQFIPQTGPGQVGRLDAGAGAGASASELLSNQVSNWLGQLSKDVNVGFNYRAKDTYSSDEFILMVSKSVFNDRLTVEGNVGYYTTVQSYASSSVVGDFNAEYKVSEDGRFRVRGFNRSNADDIIKYSQSTYTQGIGVFYRKEANSFWDFFRNAKKKERPVVNTNP
ncbi:MAG: translocation/assembly module TamB [Bacteroidetes bacterium]|nr:translocation/assembly module TamB [Bacteroidota bacterium]